MLKPYHTAWAAPDGTVTRTTVMGYRFSHYIDGVRFWFIAHQTSAGSPWRVTDPASGRQVLTMAAGVGQTIPQLARNELDKLAAAKGAARVRQALTKASA